MDTEKRNTQDFMEEIDDNTKNNKVNKASGRSTNFKYEQRFFICSLSTISRQIKSNNSDKDFKKLSAFDWNIIADIYLGKFKGKRTTEQIKKCFFNQIHSKDPQVRLQVNKFQKLVAKITKHISEIQEKNYETSLKNLYSTLTEKKLTKLQNLLTEIRHNNYSLDDLDEFLNEIIELFIMTQDIYQSRLSEKPPKPKKQKDKSQNVSKNYDDNLKNSAGPLIMNDVSFSNKQNGNCKINVENLKPDIETPKQNFHQSVNVNGLTMAPFNYAHENHRNYEIPYSFGNHQKFNSNYNFTHRNERNLYSRAFHNPESYYPHPNSSEIGYDLNYRHYPTEIEPSIRHYPQTHSSQLFYVPFYGCECQARSASNIHESFFRQNSKENSFQDCYYHSETFKHPTHCTFLPNYRNAFDEREKNYQQKNLYQPQQILIDYQDFGEYSQDSFSDDCSFDVSSIYRSEPMPKN